MASTKKYSLSFTTAGLLRKETITVALLYLNVKIWEKTRQCVMEDNALQMKSENSRHRVFSEIKTRLECLSDVEKQILCSTSFRDADVIFWLALCRRYQFIGNFAKTVLHEKYITMQRYVDFSDYALFVEREAVLHPEILNLRDSTSKRLRQMVFQFMRNCNMLNRENMIQPVIFSPAVETLFKDGTPEEMCYFPVVQKMRAN